jgi:hypothetical protein
MAEVVVSNSFIAKTYNMLMCTRHAAAVRWGGSGSTIVVDDVSVNETRVPAFAGRRMGLRQARAHAVYSRCAWLWVARGAARLACGRVAVLSHRWRVSGAHVLSQLDVFCAEVLPLYFNHSNYASFVRQLNMYCFRKLTVSDGTECEREYFHPHFARDRLADLAVRCRPFR